MARHTSHVCDWRDEQIPDATPCGDEAPYDATIQVDGVVLVGDFCGPHKDLMIERLRRFAGMWPASVKVDSKSRNSYVTASGKVVAIKDVREWALAEGRTKAKAGRLADELVQEFLETH